MSKKLTKESGLELCIDLIVKKILKKYEDLFKKL